MSTSNQENLELPNSSNISQHTFDSPLTLNDFVIIAPIMRGSFNKIDKVKYKKNGQIYAMKQYDKNWINKNKVNQIHYKREKSILYELTKIGYPTIAKLYADFEDGDTINLIQEYAEGITLNKLRGKENEQGYISQDLIINILTQLLETLEFLHNKCHIMHRDIKPDNIIIQNNNQIKLIDFNISAYLENENEELVSRKSFVGELHYVAPEILFKRNNFNYDYKVDIFSLGFTMYSLMNPTDNAQPNLPQITQRSNSEFTRINQNLENKFYSQKLIEFVKLLYEDDQDKRPTASEALEQLKNIQL